MFPGLRATLRCFTPGYCSIGASGAQHKCINYRQLSNSSWIAADEESKNEELERQVLTRISHQFSTAAADPGMSTALRSVGFLDVLSSTPAESSLRAPCIHARLRRLATKTGEKCGLIVQFQ